MKRPPKPGRGAVATCQQLCAVLDCISDESLDTSALRLADQRTQLDSRIATVADPQGARAIDETLDERAVKRAVDVDALDAGADLAAVREGSPERTLDRAIEIGIVKDEHRILPAELERDRAQSFAGAAPDDAAGLGRTGEEERVDQAVPDERSADALAPPLHDPYQPSGCDRHAGRAPRSARRRAA